MGGMMGGKGRSGDQAALDILKERFAAQGWRHGLAPADQPHRPSHRPAASGLMPLPSQAPSPPAAPSTERSRADLIERTRTVIAAGDIEAGRFALSQMVESGNASAAVDLGSTYDPNILGVLGVRNFPADVGKARVWYQRAQQMGAPEAVKLLESLESRER